MFIGIQNGKVISVKETKEELENTPCVEFDEIKETSDNYKMVKCEWRLNGYKTEEEVRQERDIFLNSILWRIERYNQQKQLNIETTDSEDEYMNILNYIQYLRDIPQDKNFPNIAVLSFEEWKKNKSI